MKNQFSQRKRIRKEHFDYSGKGDYFITVCAFENQLLFGKFRNNRLWLNPTGKMIAKWWEKLPEKFVGIELGDYVVMPNHFHGIITIVGADPRSARMEKADPWSARPRFTHLGSAPKIGCCTHEPSIEPNIPRIIQWFKAMSANEFGRMNYHDELITTTQLWQRSFYDHIIKNDGEYQRISAYIRNNPGKWIADRFRPMP